MIFDNKFGLVLTGGGAKGAYQIGAWKALRELGFDKNIGAISGASVGALNGVLIAQNDYELAEHIWIDLSDKMILTRQKLETTDILKFIASLSIKWGPMLATNISFLISNGIFSREGLRTIIKEHLDLEKIKKSSQPINATCCKIPNFSRADFTLNNQNSNNITDILCATSAIPIVFEPEKVDNNYYFDGGLVDNAPIKPLYDIGYKNILVINIGNNIIKKSDYPDANILELKPRIKLKGLLKFSQEDIAEKMERGYNEVLYHLKAYDFAKLFRAFAIYEIEKLFQSSQVLEDTLDDYAIAMNANFEELDKLLEVYKEQQKNLNL